MQPIYIEFGECDVKVAKFPFEINLSSSKAVPYNRHYSSHHPTSWIIIKNAMFRVGFIHSFRRPFTGPFVRFCLDLYDRLHLMMVGCRMVFSEMCTYDFNEYWMFPFSRFLLRFMDLPATINNIADAVVQMFDLNPWHTHNVDTREQSLCWHTVNSTVHI